MNSKEKKFPALLIFGLLLAFLTAGCVPPSTIKKEEGPLAQAQKDFEIAKKLMNKGSIAEAEKIFLKSYKTTKKHNFAKGNAMNLQWLGLIDLQKGKAGRGIAKLEKALKMAKEFKDDIHITSLLNLLGKAYTDKNKYTKALDYYRESAEMSSKTGNKLGQAITLNNIGKVYFTKGDHSQAMGHYLVSLEIFINIGDKARAFIVLNNLRLLNK